MELHQTGSKLKKKIDPTETQAYVVRNAMSDHQQVMRNSWRRLEQKRLEDQLSPINDRRMKKNVQSDHNNRKRFYTNKISISFETAFMLENSSRLEGTNSAGLPPISNRMEMHASYQKLKNDIISSESSPDIRSDTSETKQTEEHISLPQLVKPSSGHGYLRASAYISSPHRFHRHPYTSETGPRLLLPLIPDKMKLVSRPENPSIRGRKHTNVRVQSKSVTGLPAINATNSSLLGESISSRSEILSKTFDKNTLLKTRMEVSEKHLDGKAQELKKSRERIDHDLKGVTISSSKLFTIHGDQPQSLIWEDHGFEIHFPEHTCLPDEDCKVKVDAVIGGHFVFPTGVEPVSAIYIISISSKLRMPSLLKIQHCVALDKASKRSRLSFYRASLKESKPPYHFKRKKGGKFDIKSNFGELQLPAFCSMAIGKDSISCRSADQSRPRSAASSSSGLSETYLDSFGSDSNITTNVVDGSITYFGQLFYMGKGLNEWQMHFIVVKNIEAFTLYVKRKMKQFEENLQLDLRFCIPDVELVLDGMKDSAKGWSIEPYTEPLTISYRHASDFGYQKEVSVPPKCMVDIYGDNTVPGHARRLNHPVFLKGALSGGSSSDKPKIFIKRTMTENKDRCPTQDIHSPTVEKNNQDRANVSIAVISCIKEEFDNSYATLKTMFENSLEGISAELFTSRLITDETRRNPSYDAILIDFNTALLFMDEIPMILQHCRKFFTVFNKIGGPFASAGHSLQQSITRNISNKLHLNFPL